MKILQNLCEIVQNLLGYVKHAELADRIEICRILLRHKIAIFLSHI